MNSYKLHKYIITDLVWNKLLGGEYGIITRHLPYNNDILYKVEFKKSISYFWLTEEELEFYTDIFKELTNNEI